MHYKINKSNISGIINPNTSKSCTHRAIILAGLYDKVTIINNYSDCDDVDETINVVEKLNVVIKKDNNRLFVYPKHEENHQSVLKIKINYSASTMRLLVPLALRYTDKLIISSTEVLINRVKDDLINFVSIISGQIDFTDDFKIIISNYKNVNEIEIEHVKSSQILSGLLFYMLPVHGTLKIKGNIPSKPYFDLTLDMILKNNIDISQDKQTYVIEDFSCPINDFNIPVDYTNLSYLYLLNSLSFDINYNYNNTNYDVPDSGLIDVVNDLKEHAFTIDINDCIDSSLTLMIISSLYHGAEFINSNRLIKKESNRLNVIKKLMDDLNIIYIDEDNKLIVKKSEIKVNDKLIYKTYHDHRIAMLLICLGAKYGIMIDDIECINKSDHLFVDKLINLGLEIKRIKN